MALEIGHVGLCVPDIEQAVAWYVEVFDLEVLEAPRALAVIDERSGEVLHDVFGERFQAARIAQLGFGNDVGLELFEFVVPGAEPTKDPSFLRPGFSHVCFTAPDFDETLARIEHAGGHVRTRSWHEYPGLPYRFVHFEDPFGNLLELHSHRNRETVLASPLRPTTD